MLDSIKGSILKSSPAKTAFVLFAIFYFLINLKYLLNAPLGIHFIRQTDSFSFILYYLHKSSFNVLDIGNLNLDFRDGKTACEFPLFYYLYSLVFKYTGVRFDLVRLVSLSLTSISVFCLANSINSVLKNILASVSIVLFVISSTVLRYYSVNLLPDSLALSFSFLGIAYIIKCFSKEEITNREFYLIGLFLTLSSLLKIYYGIYFLFFVSVLFFDKRLTISRCMYLAFCSLLVLSWYLFSIIYNHINGATYYLTAITPIWALTSLEISTVFNYMMNYWYTKYYLPSLFHLIIAIILTNAIPKIFEKTTVKRVLVLLTLDIAYLILFFKQFKDHDYYFLALIPSVLLLMTLSVNRLDKYLTNIYLKNTSYTIILGFGLAGFNYTELNMQRRFTNSVDNFSIVSYQLNGVNNYRNSVGIDDNAKFIVIGDRTMNGSLVMLNNFGWTFENFKKDPAKWQATLDKADYLLVISPSENQIPDRVKIRLEEKKLNFRSNHIYKIIKTPAYR